jgi:hypothetical protein
MSRTIAKEVPYEGPYMKAETTKLTVRLPKEDVEFAKAYALKHGMTLTEFIDRYFRSMRAMESQSPTPQLGAITGILPSDIDTEALYRKHVLEKHGR